MSHGGFPKFANNMNLETIIHRVLSELQIEGEIFPEDLQQELENLPTINGIQIKFNFMDGYFYVDYYSKQLDHFIELKTEKTFKSIAELHSELVELYKIAFKRENELYF